jgi:hypothetical protein
VTSQDKHINFQTFVRKLTDDYISLGGHVTTEFSSSPNDWEVKVSVLREESERLKGRESLFNSRWVVYECSACKKYDSTRPLHVSIETVDFFPVDYDEVNVLFDAARNS